MEHIMQIANRYMELERYAVNNANRMVIRALDERLGRQVVLKGEPNNMASLIRTEANILAAINSRYVVTCFDIFSTDSMTFMSVEYYSKNTLEHLMAHHRKLDIARALPIAYCLLTALKDINTFGYLHRDLCWKHLSYRDRSHMKLFDMGLAIECKHGGSVRNPSTDGTWETMAPEEFKMNVPITAAANVYSAACLIYSLFAGYYPLEYKLLIPDWVARFSHQSNIEKNAQYELHLTGTIDWSPIPVHLRSPLAKALAKDPAHRYQSAGEFAQQLMQ
ncbi:MAG: protein kinase [bacterium]